MSTVFLNYVLGRQRRDDLLALDQRSFFTVDSALFVDLVRTLKMLTSPAILAGGR